MTAKNVAEANNIGANNIGANNIGANNRSPCRSFWGLARPDLVLTTAEDGLPWPTQAQSPVVGRRDALMG